MVAPRMTSGQREILVEDLQTRAARAATGLHQELGLKEEGALAIMMRNDFPFFEAMQACTHLGAYPVPVNWHLSPQEATYVLEDCGAQVVIVHSDIYHRIKEAIPAHITALIVPTPIEIASAYGLSSAACSPPEQAGKWLEWPLWLEQFEPWQGAAVAARGSMIYTSGTTGNPKGVRREAYNEAAQQDLIEAVMKGFGLDFGAKAVMTGPLYHSATNAYGSSVLTLGGDLHLMPRFDPELLLQLIERHKISHMHMVPTLFVRLLKLPAEVRSKYDLSSLVAITHGAAPCPPEVKRDMIEWWGPVINEYYGSTEAGLVSVATSEDALKKPGTVGKLLPGTELRIYNDDNELCGPNETGELYARRKTSPQFTYQNKDQARREIDRDGFITNGDIGMLDEEGYLFIMDRKRDMIISGGVNIYPAEIEAVLLQHPHIADAAVFGIPDDEFGEAICAYVQPHNAVLDESELRAWIEERCGRFKTPKTIRFSEQLPREETGKIFKRKLREPFWEGREKKI